MPVTFMADVVQLADTAVGNSKTFVVGTAKEWKLLSVYTRLTSTATAGNRLVVLSLTDASDNVIAKFVAGAVQAASLTQEIIFASEVPNDAAFSSGVMTRGLAAGILLPAGYKIKVADANNITASDTLVVRALVEERGA